MGEVSGRRRRLSQVIWMEKNGRKHLSVVKSTRKLGRMKPFSRNEVRISLAKAEGPFATRSNEVLFIEQLSSVKFYSCSIQCKFLVSGDTYKLSKWSSAFLDSHSSAKAVLRFSSVLGFYD